MTTLEAKNGASTTSAPTDGAQANVEDVGAPPSVVTVAPQPVEPTTLVRQPSLPGARPRRSCLRRQSTATTVCSAGVASAVGEGGLSDELKVQMTAPLVEGQGDTPPAPVLPMPRSVSFLEKAAVQEYGMILGDHPCVDRGPPLTMSWTVQDAYQQNVIDHENPRRGVQLRIPANLRTEVVSVTASEAEISKATFEVRKLRSQRHSTVAMQELEGFQILWQSAVRKVKRWQRKKKLQRAASLVESSTEPPLCESLSPAEAWLEANTTRRGGRLVLKPGAVPYDPSTALTVDDESADEVSPLSADCGSMDHEADSPTESQAAARSWSSVVSKPQSQHQRKVSEDDSQETAPTVVSTLDGDASATDEDEPHELARSNLSAKDEEILM